MDAKRTDTRFTIRFNGSDPVQLQAAELLKKQARRGKARHIAIALLHYENCKQVTDVPQTAQVDEQFIESVVKRVINKQGYADSDRSTANPVNQDDSISEYAKEIDFDEAMEVLGEDGLDAVLGSLDMFRRK